jgi:hypothetical protein
MYKGDSLWQDLVNSNTKGPDTPDAIRQRDAIF